MKHIDNLRAIGDRIKAVAAKNNLQIIADDDTIVIQPDCYLYDDPTMGNGDDDDDDDDDEDEYYYLNSEYYPCTTYMIGKLSEPNNLSLIGSEYFLQLTHFYYRRVRQVLRAFNQLKQYIIENNLNIGYQTDAEKELLNALGFRQASIWKCWTKDVPIYVRKLVITCDE